MSSSSKELKQLKQCAVTSLVPRSVRRVLISRLSAHGDVIQTLPLLAALKSADPELFVGWVVEASAASLLENHPLIDALHVSERKQWFAALRKNPFQVFNVWQQFWQFRSEICAVRYDVACDVQGLLKSALIPFFAGIPRRLGYHRTREHADWFYTEHLPFHDLKNPDLPTVVKFMAFAQHLGLLEEEDVPKLLREHVRYPLPAPSVVSVDRAEALFATLLPGVPVVAIAPGTAWDSKHWPVSHWVQLVELLFDEASPGKHPNVVIFGGPAEQSLVTQLFAELSETRRAQGKRQVSLFNWVGQTGLADLYEIFSRVDVFIGSDSAPLHIANAVASASDAIKPVIMGLYGSTSARRTGPVGGCGNVLHETFQQTLSCQPCFKRKCPLSGDSADACMADISPQIVFEKVQRVLEIC